MIKNSNLLKTLLVNQDLGLKVMDIFFLLNTTKLGTVDSRFITELLFKQDNSTKIDHIFNHMKKFTRYKIVYDEIDINLGDISSVIKRVDCI